MTDAVCWIAVVIVVALFLRYQNRVLQRLSFLANEALATRIVETERLKSAEARLELYEREDRHMCLTPGCRNSVIGKLIFAHCERHLERYEQQWVESKLELEGRRPPSKDEHPVNKTARELTENLDQERIQQNAADKMRALAEARNLLKNALSQKLERRAYLPQILQGRLEREEKEQQRAIGGSWLPLNLVESINQEAEKR